MQSVTDLSVKQILAATACSRLGIGHSRRGVQFTSQPRYFHAQSVIVEF